MNTVDATSKAGGGNYSGKISSSFKKPSIDDLMYTFSITLVSMYNLLY